MQYGIGKLLETEREYQRALQVIPHVNRWTMVKPNKSKMQLLSLSCSDKFALSQRITTTAAQLSQTLYQHRHMHPPRCVAVGTAMRGGKACNVPEGALYACPGYVPCERSGDGLCACDCAADHAEKHVHRCASRRRHDWRTESDDAAGAAYARFASRGAGARARVSRSCGTQHPRARRRPAGGPGGNCPVERYAQRVQQSS